MFLTFKSADETVLCGTFVMLCKALVKQVFRYNPNRTIVNYIARDIQQLPTFINDFVLRAD